MDQLSSIFTKIVDFLNASSWFPLLQWPFWTLLIILALCGVYTARFGKGKLLCLGFQGALKLAIIYMVAAGLYALRPSWMADLSQLPLLYVSKDSLTLVNPLELLDRWNTALPGVLVRLYFLLLMINIANALEYNPSNPVSWCVFQFISALISVGVYAGLSFAISSFWPAPLSLLHNIVAILLLLLFTLLLVFKLYFTFFKKGGNHSFQVLFQAMTEKKYGSPFTVSAISFLIVLAYVVVAALFGHDTYSLSAFNPAAYLLSCLLCIGTLYCFSRYYNSKSGG